MGVRDRTLNRTLLIWWPLAIAGGLFTALNYADPHLFLVGWSVLTVGVLGLMGDT